jgi:hypothetical protein
MRDESVKYKENYRLTPKDVVNVVDLSYLGIEKYFPDLSSSLPYKKRNLQTSQKQKEYNKNHFQNRIVK